MKIIDLLNKIANGEIDRNNKYQFSKDDYCTINDFFARYIVDEENLNLEILEEEKKIPEKIEYYDDSIAWVIDGVGQLSNVDKVIIDKLNEVLDCINSKGDE